MSQHSARGKAFERHVAALFGYRRRRNGEGIDFDDCVQLDGSLAPISIECKAHSVPQIREEWLEQAERNAKGRPWVLVQRRRKGSRELLATVPLDYLKSLIPGDGDGGNGT